MRKTLLTAAFLLICVQAHAQVSIETAVSRSQLGVGDEFTLDIIIENAEGSIARPTFPPLDGFTSYSQGHSQEISFINGRKSSRSIFSYVLIANAPGKRKIGPFEINIGGRAFKAAAVEVTVSGSSSAAAPVAVVPSQVSAPPQRALPSTTVANDDIFVKAWLDKDEVYVNEPVMLTYTLYTRLSATYKGFEKEPETTGFWVEDFPPEKTIRRTEQFLNGSRYVVADVRKLALFPTQAGVFTVDPGTLSAIVEVRSSDPFDTFISSNVFGRRSFGSTFNSQMVSRVIKTQPVTVTAKALPEAGRPADFSGAIGQYGIDSSLDKSRVKEGEAVTFRVRLTGQGNLNTAQVPSLPPMDAFKIYDSSSAVNISKERLVVEGEKVTETVIVPKKEGTYTIPSLSFSYFDPRSRGYRTIKTQPRVLTVEPAPEGERGVIEEQGVRPAEQKEVAFVGKDIRYLKTKIGDSRHAATLYKNILYWLVNLAFVVAFLIGVRRKTGGDPLAAKWRRSHQVAKNKLRHAERKLREESRDEFYAEITKAVYGYFGDKLGLAPQAVTLDAVRERMTDDARSQELAAKTAALLEELAHGRFAQVQKNKDDMRHVYHQADELITAFERQRPWR